MTIVIYPWPSGSPKYKARVDGSSGAIPTRARPSARTALSQAGLLGTVICRISFRFRVRLVTGLAANRKKTSLTAYWVYPI